MLNWVIETALRHRAAVLLAALVAVLGGTYALAHLDIDAFPDTTPVQVQINTNAPALGPEDVEAQITAPIEQALGGLPKLKAVRSVSKFGLSQVVVTFDDGTDTYFVRQLVAERLAAVPVPAGIDRPALGPVSTGLGEVFHYMLALKGRDLAALPEPERVEKLVYLRTLQDWAVKPKLRTVPGVAEVNAWGGCEKQVQVKPDPAKLRRHGVTVADVVAALEKNNRNVGGGGVRDNSQFLLVQGTARAETLDQIRATAVADRNGSPVRVGEVATVEVGYEVRRGSATFQGRGEAVLGLCFLTAGENSKTVSTALRARLDEIRPTLPADVEIVPVYDRTELVDVVIATVRRNLFEGGLLVIAVLFAFLGSARATAIVALAIPLSLVFAFAGMWQFGIAASLLSLGALDFGMVVDSSVVLVENCVRHIAHGDARGRSKTEVVRDAAVEVRRPTLFGELIIALVYVPILALEGTEGKLFRPMALTVIFALLGSMLLSMTLMPVLASLLLPRRMADREPVLMRAAMLLYRPVLAVTMHCRAAVALVAAGLLVLAFGLVAPNLGTEFVPRLSEGAVAIGIVRLAGTDLDESNRINTAMEKMLLAEFPDEIRHVWSRVGTAEVSTDPMGIELTDLFITLHPRPKWTKAAAQADLTEKIDAVLRAVPGQKLAYSQPIEMRMNEMEAGIRSDVGVRVFGDDYTVLAAAAAKVEAALKTVPGAQDVSVEPFTGQPGVRVTPNRDALARYGIPAETVLTLVQAVGSVPVGEIVDGQMRFPLSVRLPDAWRGTADAVAAIPVSVPAGGTVPLARLATVRPVEGPSTISREAGQRRVTVTANVRGRDVGGFVAEARRALEPVAAGLPKGRYALEFGGRYESYDRGRARLLVVVPAAGALIFALLFFTYRNAVDALRVLTGVPFGWVGGLLALWARDLPLSLPALVGFIALSGVAILDDMILVSTVRNLRRTGLGVEAAVRAAALLRLRPVLMTTLVAGLGFLPMALSTGEGAEVQRPLATVVIGGVIGAMVMSLLVLRVLYLVFDAAARGALWVLTRGLGVPERAASAALGLSDFDDDKPTVPKETVP